MADFPEVPPRPLPPRRLGDSIRSWLVWFGLGRLIATACCTLIVVTGAYWLVRAPAPPPEATIPLTSSGSAAAATAPVVTLPRPPGRSTESEPNSVVVHVAGAVRVPGVYTLGGDDRVHDAVSAAGGATGDADLAGLNLAAPLADGARIYVPLSGEVDPATVPSGVLPLAGDASATQPVDLNRATVVEFEALPGVGPATAAAIVGDRDQNGPFASVDDLDRVPGIGPAKLAALRDLVTV